MTIFKHTCTIKVDIRSYKGIIILAKIRGLKLTKKIHMQDL